MDVSLGLLTLVVVVCAASALGRRLNLSVPLLLVVVGVIGSYLPFIPAVKLDPELVLVGILPPLLYAAAIRTSLVEFRTNLRSIGLLSVGYVIFGTVAIGLIVWWLIPEIPVAAAFALGAVVAPPDAVAATTIARRVGLPRRVVSLLEGESLVNDATALVLLRTAIVAIGGSVTVWQVASDLAFAAGGAVVIGLVAAWLLLQIRKRVRNVAINTSMSLAAPFVAYIPAEGVNASGVLAVVVAGLVIGTRTPAMPGGASRLSQRSNWATVQFLLENSVFLLIGLQVRSIIEATSGDSLGAGRIWGACAVILVAVLLLRPIWVFPAIYLPRLIPKIRQVDPAPPWQLPTIVSWAGMRGVVTLAAVFALPEGVAHRPVLVLAALGVVAGTLVVQGLSLPRLVRLLGVRGPDTKADALSQAALMDQATAAGIENLRRHTRPDDPPEVLDMLERRTQERNRAAWERLGRSEFADRTPSKRYVQLRLAMLDAERARVLKLRRSGEYAHEVISEVLEMLDVEESMLDTSPDDAGSTFSAEAPAAIRPDTAGVPLGAGGCEHLRAVGEHPVPPDSKCYDCVREGTTPVHLRMCLLCGKVGCCDSSVGQHATRHFQESGHPIMCSAEPRELWRWCYVDELLG
ncbi:Na+/H+ antiporter [Cryobacterium sp. TMT1-2-2]|uniref:Na+/H+ antiporter n=1 Tax=Cryobacterium sp. TMT1-2-2 TaxID=1259233 RepID=UPI00106937A8|nr:Na+/H+ antiporter [Cryobacterium sp. TMT1-2-2]TFD15230.1 Na+/H+ antiporter [Cryobacterium sp. TMT1-2-2]